MSRFIGNDPEWQPPPAEFTHKDKLPPENPLREVPFWNNPDGKNLNIIHALRWALAHLKHCQGELPCVENDITEKNILGAIAAQEERYKLRNEQGVLGSNHKHESTGYILASH